MNILSCQKRKENLTCLSGKLLEEKSCSEVKTITNKAYKHICRHAKLTDLKLLLERMIYGISQLKNMVIRQWKDTQLANHQLRQSP